MQIEIYDWQGKPRVCDIGNLDTVSHIVMNVITGDEMLTVTYKNGAVTNFDSSNTRWADFIDDTFLLYDYGAGINKLNKKKFLNRNKTN